MIYTYKYKSPLGHILLAEDEVGITGLWFEGQKLFWEYTSRQAYSTGNRDSHGSEKNGWMFISPVKNRNLLRQLHPDGSTFRLGSVEDFIADSLWTDDHIRRNCPQKWQR